jgi:transcriptional regulator with XRE-family HTH domain
MVLSERLRSLRQAQGLSQEAVARRAGMGLRGYSDIERGVATDPHYSTLSAIAEALGTTIARLVGEEELIPLAEALGEAGLDGLSAAARLLKGEWRRLAAYDRVAGLSSEEYLDTMRRLEELEEELSLIKERYEDLDPPLATIHYRLDERPRVEFYRTPTAEEEADLKSRLGDYEAEHVFELVP